MIRLPHEPDDDPPPRWLKPCGSMAGLPDGAQRRHFGLAVASTCRTPGQRRRLKRNVVIAAAHRQGVSMRVLADVFQVARSRVAEIIEEVEGRSCR